MDKTSSQIKPPSTIELSLGKSKDLWIGSYRNLSSDMEGMDS